MLETKCRVCRAKARRTDVGGKGFVNRGLVRHGVLDTPVRRPLGPQATDQYRPTVVS